MLSNLGTREELVIAHKGQKEGVRAWGQCSPVFPPGLGLSSIDKPLDFHESLSTKDPDQQNNKA